MAWGKRFERAPTTTSQLSSYSLSTSVIRVKIIEQKVKYDTQTEKVPMLTEKRSVENEMAEARPSCHRIEWREHQLWQTVVIFISEMRTFDDDEKMNGKMMVVDIEGEAITIWKNKKKWEFSYTSKCIQMSEWINVLSVWAW